MDYIHFLFPLYDGVPLYLLRFFFVFFFFFSSRRRHTRWPRDWSSDVCSSDLPLRLTASIQSLSSIPAASASSTLIQMVCPPRERFIMKKFSMYIEWIAHLLRSEERRVGKECRSRWWREE